MKIRLTKGSRYKMLDTPKAIAIGYTRKNPHFISRKHSLLVDVSDGVWDIIIPDWMIHTNEDLKLDMELLWNQNKMNDNTTDFRWKEEKNL